MKAFPLRHRFIWTVVFSTLLSLVMSVTIGETFSAVVHAQTVLPRPDHIVLVMEENHSFSEIIGLSSAPYINSLANKECSLPIPMVLLIPASPIIWLSSPAPPRVLPMIRVPIPSLAQIWVAN